MKKIDNRISIRPATIDDAELLVQFIEALADYEKLRHQCEVTPEVLRDKLFNAALRPAAEALIGEIDGEPRGFALFFTTFSTFLGKPGIYLEDLFVNPDSRGKGLGKALLLHIAKTARDRNHGRVEWSVLNWNTAAIEFYKSLGAKPMDEWSVYRLDRAALDRLA